MSKVAVTAVAALTVTVQVVAAPLQAPPQPANWAPASGVAISVTIVSRANAALHVVPQLMPPGFEVIVPAAVPSLVTVRVAVPGGASVGSASTTALSSAGASTIGMKVGSSVAQGGEGDDEDEAADAAKQWRHRGSLAIGERDWGSPPPASPPHRRTNPRRSSLVVTPKPTICAHAPSRCVPARRVTWARHSRGCSTGSTR
jgi:hypothetical protein